MARIASTYVLCAAGLMLSGCGNAVTDMFGFGKAVPDERLVRTHQTLAVPPDLQLRPPTQNETVTGVPNPAARQAANQNADAKPSTDIGTTVVPPADARASAEQTSAEQPTALGQPSTPGQQAQPTGDIFDRHGISKTHPGGREKSHVELMRELRKVRLERKRAQNPNYGTIFNLPNIFSGN